MTSQVGSPAATDPRLHPDVFWPRLRAALEQVPAEERTLPPDARSGAVLILLEETDAGPRVVLTRRRRDLRSHPGQVSFPGGRRERGETTEQAALREANEEVGLRPETVEVLGVAPVFYIPPSRFWVAPVVARWRSPHPLTPSPDEVDAILQVPLAHLLDPVSWRRTPLSVRGRAWAWQLDDDLLWGATAILTALLLDTAVGAWHGDAGSEQLADDREVRPWEQTPMWPRRKRLRGEVPTLDQAILPHVTAAQVREVRAWLGRHGVGPLERALREGRAAAEAVQRLTDDARSLRVTVLAGPSSNGAAGLAAARLLAADGIAVEVLTVGEPRHPGQLDALRAADVEVAPVTDAGVGQQRSPGGVVLDAVLGVGTDPPLRGLPEATTRWLSRHATPVVALELPSGIAMDGRIGGVCVAADVSIALGLPPIGLRSRMLQAYAGDVYLADLGIPAAAWRSIGVEVDDTLFAEGPLVRLALDESGADVSVTT